MDRKSILRISGVCAIAVLGTFVAFAGEKERPTGLTARGAGVWLPSYDANGKLKSQILGDSMVMVEDKIEVSGLTMEILTNGVVDVRMTSEKCLYRPKHAEISSSYPLSLERTNMVMSGIGFNWKEAKARVKILKDVRVTVHDIQEWIAEGPEDVAKDERPARDVETTITANRLIFRYAEGTGFFDGGVKATDGEMIVSANTMMVVFNEDNSARTLEADGGVTIVQGDMTSTCDRAFCNIEDQHILLHGNAEAMRGNEIARGEKIVLLPKHDRIICQPGYLKVASFDNVDKLIDGERKEDQ